MIFDARGKSGGEPHAVQTLREVANARQTPSVWSAAALALLFGAHKFRKMRPENLLRPAEPRIHEIG
jgi:hypothetical protein